MIKLISLLIESLPGKVRSGTAKEKVQCVNCGKTINKGDSMISHAYRERATSSAEARNAGTMYPWRFRRYCTDCDPRK